MRATSACLAAIAMLMAAGSRTPSPASRDYAAIVRAYQSGDAEAAITRLRVLEGQTLQMEFKEFFASPPPRLVAAAVALHTEVALRSRLNVTGDVAERHLRLAASIVDVGEPPKVNRLGSVTLHERAFAPIAPPFRRLWYITVITRKVADGGIADTDPYLQNARVLFPHDADILLLSGIAEEMRASYRHVNATAGDRRVALDHAEAYLRESFTIAPDRLETKIRLGRVLQQRGRLEQARDLLTPLSGLQDPRLSYLASLFLGGLEDAAGNPGSAAGWYARAQAALPSAQSARLAASELLHREGKHRQAAASLASAIGATNVADPWWAYLFGEFWRVDSLLDALRRISRS
jgi:hypothetical protein